MEHHESTSQEAYLEIPVESPPERIVSLVPSMTESLFELNLGTRVVGRTDDCVLPVGRVGAVPSMGSPQNPVISMIIDLRPDLVIVNQDENRKEDAGALMAAGIPVWVTFPKTIRDVFNMLWNVMYVCEETSMVPRVRLMEYTYDWVLGVTKANDDRICKVFAPISVEPLRTFNGETYSHDLLTACGGANVFADQHMRYPEVSWGDVEAAQPDVILLPDGSNGFTEADRSEAAVLDVPAARHHRVHLIDQRLLTWYGIRLAFALEQIPPLFGQGMLASEENETSGV